MTKPYVEYAPSNNLPSFFYSASLGLWLVGCIEARCVVECDVGSFFAEVGIKVGASLMPYGTVLRRILAGKGWDMVG